MRSFEDILGQNRAIEALTTAWQRQRLPHGLIFAGPVGVGKATTARALAGLFLCEHPQNDRPCGRCPSCTVFAADNHPDFHLVYRQLVRVAKEEAKARDLSINVIREYLIGPANHKSIMLQGKVFVVEEAELMSASAQNAMLKTLEEPSGRTLIILITSQPDQLLPTIRSRCQMIRFAALPIERVRGELEKRGFDPQEALDAAELADGSLGLALKWIEDGVVTRWLTLRQRLEQLISGRVVSDLPEWMKAAAEAYAEKQQEHDALTSKDQATREGISLYLRFISAELARRLKRGGESEQLETLCEAIDAVTLSERYIESNVTVGLVYQQFAVSLERLLPRCRMAG